MKKIRGKIHYFGRWGKRVNGKMERLPGDGWQEALALYKAQADDLHAGKKPRTTPDNEDGLSLRELCNRYWKAKYRKHKAGELSIRSLREYEQTTDLLIEFLGKDRLVEDLGADDFEELRADMAKRWGPVRLAKIVTQVKGVFKFAYDNHLIDRPIRYGSEFQKPGKAVLRRHKAENGNKSYNAEEIRQLIEASSPPFDAMLLLAINAGLGNSDVGNLQKRHIDLEGGWLEYPRPKTGIERRAKLWPETVEALKVAIAQRSEPKDEADADCVFLTPHGRWVRSTGSGMTDNVHIRFRRLARRIGVYRQGLSFYAIRHTFQSVADGARDPVAVKLVMGHTDNTMSGNYRQWVADENLQAVTDHVRQWLEGGVK